MSGITGTVDSIDAQMNKINAKIAKFGETDPDIAVIADVLRGTEKKINVACAAADNLDRDARNAARSRR